MKTKLLLAFGLLFCSTTPARALCIYHGVDNVKTTIAQEFRDSRWVVRARLVSADYHWSDEGESWSLYRLEVIQSFKGELPRQFAFFTARNSGGFYMDNDRGGPDLERDYLLFLTRDGWSTVEYPAATGALWVNYNCGQSKPWSELTLAQAKEIYALAAKQ